MIAEQSILIAVPAAHPVTGVWRTAANPRHTLIYAPGAGASLTDGFGQHLAEVLPPQGFAVLRFQFPYTEAGRRLPDRPPVLEATWRAAIGAARDRTERLV